MEQGVVWPISWYDYLAQGWLESSHDLQVHLLEEGDPQHLVWSFSLSRTLAVLIYDPGPYTACRSELTVCDGGNFKPGVLQFLEPEEERYLKAGTLSPEHSQLKLC